MREKSSCRVREMVVRRSTWSRNTPCLSLTKWIGAYRCGIDSVGLAWQLDPRALTLTSAKVGARYFMASFDGAPYPIRVISSVEAPA